MADMIAVVAIFAVVGAALFYIIKSKKDGVKCIGCPHAGKCSKCESKNKAQ